MIPRYRAWISEADTMTNDLKGIDFENETVVLKKFYWEDGFPVEEEVFEVEIGNAIIMKSTGLVDKNCKEIFEGDVVQFEDCSEASDFLYINTGIIEWCQGGFHVTNRDSVLMEDLLDGDSLDVTIIGNVYENPELLEDK